MQVAYVVCLLRSIILSNFLFFLLLFFYIYLPPTTRRTFGFALINWCCSSPLSWAPFLSLEGLLSTVATLSSFYLFAELRLLVCPFPAFIWWELDQLCMKKKPSMFEMNKIIFRPHLEAFLGFLAKTKMKAETKLTVVMCCQIFQGEVCSAI